MTVNRESTSARCAVTCCPACRIAHLVNLHDAGEHTTAQLGELFGVARSTVYRTVKRAQASTGT